MIASPQPTRDFRDAREMAQISHALQQSHRMGISLVWCRGLWRHTFYHGWVEVDPESMKEVA